MKAHPNSPIVITTTSTSPISFIGPPLSLGALPAVFYFSLSAEESLALDPYSQPAIALSQMGVRVFSLTLPAHEGAHPHPGSMNAWAESAAGRHDFIRDFVGECRKALDYLMEEGYIIPGKIGAAGLSRGAFAAAHFAASDDRVKYLLGFSPLTRLGALKEFEHVVQSDFELRLSLHSIVDELVGKVVRFYIGNRDTCVSIDDCFAFIRLLTEAAYEKKHRSPPVELIIYPSVGHKGHGTPPHIFLSGAEWLGKQLLDNLPLRH